MLCLMLVNFSYAQNFITQISKEDSIKLRKKDELKEDGLVFYRDEYSLSIFIKENIKHNREKKYKIQEFADGRKYCEKCKPEVYYFSIKKVKQIPKNLKYQVITTNQLLHKLNQYSWGGNYFLINNTYYRNLGMPIE